jgi:hypothetical protein
MPPQHFDNLTLKDEIITAFRPVEQLFRIMDKSPSETSGDLIRSYGEVGLELCQNFRRKLDTILNIQDKEKDDDCR